MNRSNIVYFLMYLNFPDEMKRYAPNKYRVLDTVKSEYKQDFVVARYITDKLHQVFSMDELREKIAELDVDDVRGLRKIMKRVKKRYYRFVKIMRTKPEKFKKLIKELDFILCRDLAVLLLMTKRRAPKLITELFGASVLENLMYIDVGDYADMLEIIAVSSKELVIPFYKRFKQVVLKFIHGKLDKKITVVENEYKLRNIRVRTMYGFNDKKEPLVDKKETPVDKVLRLREVSKSSEDLNKNKNVNVKSKFNKE